jgi:hypothetical protein
MLKVWSKSINTTLEDTIRIALAGEGQDGTLKDPPSLRRFYRAFQCGVDEVRVTIPAPCPEI